VLGRVLAFAACVIVASRYCLLSPTFELRQLRLCGGEKPTKCLQCLRAYLFSKEKETTAPLDEKAQIPYAIFHGVTCHTSVATGGSPALLSYLLCDSESSFLYRR
jgi:hypothetical protein